jgi:hypothetical protein
MSSNLVEFNQRFFYGIVARKCYFDMNGSECRKFLLKSNLTFKNMILFFTSYFPQLMKFILKNYDIGGVKKFNRNWK